SPEEESYGSNRQRGDSSAVGSIDPEDHRRFTEAFGSVFPQQAEEHGELVEEETESAMMIETEEIEEIEEAEPATDMSTGIEAEEMPQSEQPHSHEDMVPADDDRSEMPDTVAEDEAAAPEIRVAEAEEEPAGVDAGDESMDEEREEEGEEEALDDGDT